MLKTIIKVGITIVFAYATIASCAVITVVILDESIKKEKSIDLFPN